MSKCDEKVGKMIKNGFLMVVCKCSSTAAPPIFFFTYDVLF